MKTKVTLSLEDSLYDALKKELSTPPRKSVSSWVEERIDEFLRKTKQA